MLTFPHFQSRFPRESWTLPAVLEHQSAAHPDRPYIRWTDAGTPLTFGQTNASANSLAHGLAGFGVGKGDMVGILLPNCLEFVLTWFALAKLGAVEVAISDAYKGDFLAHPINLSQTQILVTSPELATRIAEIEDKLPSLEALFLIEGEASAPHFNRIAVHPFNVLRSGNESNPGIAVKPSDPAAVLMTSGTTGVSKGVVMPHSQFYFFAEEDVQLMRLTEDDVYMTGFPLFHGNAQFLTVYPSLIAGAQVVLYPRFSASDWAGRAKRSGATVTNLLGATMAFILAGPPSEDDRTHNVRTIYAAPLAPELGRRFTERFGVSDYVDGFGQTEISNVFMTPHGAKRPDGASGVLVDQWFEVRLADPETGEDVPEGESGELLVRPKAPGIICSEYLGMPEKTVETWRDLWFHTGDGLRRDAEGWYYFVDRVKDALRRRGENISSFEVEAGVRKHPAVAECAVVGVRADEDAGEDEVMAFIVLAEGESAAPEDIIAACDVALPAFMVPRYLEFVDALPQTATEKVRKKALRERGIGERTWDRLAPATRREAAQ
ncbi:AMP-binding protein [Sphingosinicella microcystinivorans]|uniref:ATP-dependent acyl-CoA ligase n=1 Tax=Sphingosinicella microcystinivorans TaxID=335406 RepID=A0AAD1G2G5_SPHMI|nr:AMP-binding protein [Sphingosinicella microcystinivorans]RKS86333.1 crotonobetaine/carnitine-CoA ligase [Sphingosinicella microcystinivorans]BBE35621.1 ATP-dependent acyl-CoA ligase [Sphingosinicella microcystinivorans]